MNTKKTSHVAKVTKILISHIDRNPHNPRRLFDEEPMAVLKESIEKLGVLVPITVYPKRATKTDSRRDFFLILDGERRWRCAIALSMRVIPAIIVEQPTEIRNILVMFHIHNLREGWQLMPTALKLEILMKKLKETRERKLATLTKLTIGQIRRCKILLTYPRRFQNLMLTPPSKRLKSDFFIELDRIRKPALKEKFPSWIKYGDENCIDIILKKYLAKTIKAVTDFRKLAEIYRGSIKRGKIKRFYEALNEFLINENYGIDDIQIPGANFERETKETNRSALRLETQLKDLENEALASNNELVTTLKRLMELIQKRLDNALLISRYGDKQ